MDVEPDRIRILSSLEGRRARGASSAAMGSRHRHHAGMRSGTPTRWWSHVLLGLMGMGLFTVALAVFLIIKSSRDSELPLTRWDIVAPATLNTGDDPDHLLSSQPPGAGVLSAEVAEAEAFGLLHQEPIKMASSPEAESASIEIIESVLPPSTSPSAPLVSAAASAPALAEPLAIASETTPGTATAKPSKPSTPAPTPAPPRTSVAAKTPAPAATNSAHQTTPQSADVRLLEAVFPKHDPRTASKAELFKACQGMTGAESAICRARICVQHPGVPACQ